MYPRSARGAPSIETIQAAVAAHTKSQSRSSSRASRAVRIAWPRQVAIHLARELTTSSLNVIGEAFGGRNHATVLHACKRVSERVLADPEAAGELDSLARSLSARQADRRC